ncbi:peptidoglycan editing factor PgeF [Myxacorys almedinensis]|uniref:Purine nucleoside phosphorylase n=1 Tax=Myxacorys almedinensis A TaxID=2690445 RepID=A0A8J7Z2S0_9CYAN|nr:peptidoglycan editing factor PgeF [Myxacorys almedinensis]NDJ18624.1 peptidoglycan editing factor PgeF [Myxacorys almedinensis A]
MHTWHWQTWNALPYLTCSLLEPWQHGFFTQQFSPRSPVDLTPVLSPDAQPYRTHQVHGSRVLAPSELPPRDNATAGGANLEALAQADGLISEHANQAVWVCSADCTPVLIANVRTGQVSGIHAGWRGTAQKIIPTAIARLCAQGGDLQDLRVAFGPAISGEVYQVSLPVAIEVGATVATLPTEMPEAEKIAALLQLPDSPILPDETPGRVRLDVRHVNRMQLEQMGLMPEQIAIAPHCTYQDPIHFFSYRREKLKKVQWSGIVSR